MFYPVQVPGALLSVGDPQSSQGDARSRDRAGVVTERIAALDHSTLICRFTVPVWSLDRAVGAGFGDTLDEAMRPRVRTLDVLVLVFGLTPGTPTLHVVAVDFTVTQVVDQRRACTAESPSGVPALPGVAHDRIRAFSFTPANGVPAGVARFSHASRRRADPCTSSADATIHWDRRSVRRSRPRPMTCRVCRRRWRGKNGATPGGTPSRA